jgi:DNA-binding winged helix-turn-helix (wHTH) protein/TolB-like protein/tetratricopeptide (TPR) repeat protein
METSAKLAYQFGPFYLDPQERLLLQGSQTIPLTPKAFDLLVFLVEREGHLIEKSELLKAVWRDSVVEEVNLPVTISALRKALADDRDEHRYIETVSKRGYRFVADVKQVDCPPKKTARPQPEAPPAPELESQTGGEVVSAPQIETEVAASSEMAPGRLFTWKLVWFILGLALVLTTFVAIIRHRGGLEVAAGNEIHSLAVLPFRNLDANSGDEYLEVGIADALIERLGNTGKIVVRPTASIQRYAGSGISPRDAGRQQGVDAVIDGSIQRDAGRVHLVLQMVRVRDGKQLWTGAFDDDLINIFALEDAMSTSVAQFTSVTIGPALTRRRPTESRDAYDAYLKGRFFWNKRTSKDIEKGLEYFHEAIALDPKFAEAYVGVADCYGILAFYAVLPPREAFPAAREAAKHALELDNSLAEAHATMGFINFYYDWNGVEATKEFRRSLGANPNYAMAHSWFSVMLAAEGKYPEAEEEANRAMEEDPLSPIIASNAGWAVSLSGNADRAITIIKKAIEIDPNFARAHMRLGRAYEQKHMLDEAISEFDRAVHLAAEEPCSKGSLGHANALAGRAEAAQQLLQGLETPTEKRYVPSYAIALIYAGLGDKDKAISWLQRAYEDRSTGMAFLRTDPELSSLHSDPRFQELSRRVSF